MYFHAPCGAALYSVMLCLYIFECNCNFYEHRKKYADEVCLCSTRRHEWSLVEAFSFKQIIHS